MVLVRDTENLGKSAQGLFFREAGVSRKKLFHRLSVLSGPDAAGPGIRRGAFRGFRAISRLRSRPFSRRAVGSRSRTKTPARFLRDQGWRGSGRNPKKTRRETSGTGRLSTPVRRKRKGSGR